MSAKWSDSPIKSSTEDAFGRAGYAVRAAELISSSHSWEDSVVFGLTGPWGSGKTSMLAMIIEQLNNRNESWHIARFTPWATSSVGGLLGDFYTSLGSALPKNRGRQARRALGTLAQITAPAAKAIPWAGAAISSTIDATGAALKKQPPWDTAFQRTVSELKKFGKPVLIVVDDIDRLQAEELLALLKVVRLIGRFPGVHYLLAYDETTLFHTLTTTSPARDDAAERFMEKIVQYPLVVPPMLSAQMFARLDSGLDSALAEAGRAELTSDRLGRLANVYRSQLATPRAVDRFLAQLRHHLPLIEPGEVDDEDFIVLTLLRTAFPRLYVQLHRWRDEVTSGHSGEFKAGVSGLEFEPFDIERLLEAVPSESREDAQALLVDLFPKLNTKKSVTRATSGRQVSDKRYFDRYFAMGIPSHDVADSDIAEAVKAACEGRGAALERLLTEEDADRLVLVIDKALKSTEPTRSDHLGDDHRIRLLQVLMPLLERMPDYRAFFLNPREHFTRWAASILSSISDNASATLIVSALSATGNLPLTVQVFHHSNWSESPRSWTGEVIDVLAQQAIHGVLAHLRARDAAPDDARAGWLFVFLRDHGKTAPAAAEIATSLENGDFEIADLAARFVKAASIVGVPGAKWRLDGFDQEAFGSYAPSTDYPWYRSPIAEIERTDLTWANRRAYAAGRAKRPSTI